MATNTERCKQWLATKPSVKQVEAKLHDVINHIAKHGEQHPKNSDYLEVEFTIRNYLDDLSQEASKLPAQVSNGIKTYNNEEEKQEAFQELIKKFGIKAERVVTR